MLEQDYPTGDVLGDSWNKGDVVSTTQLCLPTGPGTLTLGLIVQDASTGLTDGNVGGSSVLIMDNYCKLLGAYSFNRCGSPFVLEANFLKYVLTIDNIFLDAGDPFIAFYYANGHYLINNNGCVCGEIGSEVVAAASGCRCAFPVDGEPTS